MRIVFDCIFENFQFVLFSFNLLKSRLVFTNTLKKTNLESLVYFHFHGYIVDYLRNNSDADSSSTRLSSWTLSFCPLTFEFDSSRLYAYEIGELWTMYVIYTDKKVKKNITFNFNQTVFLTFTWSCSGMPRYFRHFFRYSSHY